MINYPNAAYWAYISHHVDFLGAPGNLSWTELTNDTELFNATMTSIANNVSTHSNSVEHTELNTLLTILAGTADSTGRHFFRALVQHSCLALNVRYAFVSVFTADDTRMKLLSLWDGDQFLEDVEYELQPTPCSEVIRGDVYHCARSIQKRFPEDTHLKDLGAESYRGVPLVGPNGKHFGHLAVVDTKPMKDNPGLVNIMQIFAMRAAVELSRLEAEERVIVSERRLDAILNDAMDVIVNINEDGVITLFNKASTLR